MTSLRDLMVEWGSIARIPADKLDDLGFIKTKEGEIWRLTKKGVEQVPIKSSLEYFSTMISEEDLDEQVLDALGIIFKHKFIDFYTDWWEQKLNEVSRDNPGYLVDKIGIEGYLRNYIDEGELESLSYASYDFESDYLNLNNRKTYSLKWLDNLF